MYSAELQHKGEAILLVMAWLSMLTHTFAQAQLPIIWMNLHELAEFYKMCIKDF